MADGLAGSAFEARSVRRVLVFTIVALALLMMSIGLTIVATALRSLQDGLHTSINWAGWTITAYSFGFVLMLPISGKLSERYGRRRVFVGSVVAFTVTSRCCGLAVIALALRYIPHDRPRTTQCEPGMDASGMALLGAGLLAGMLAISYLGEKNAHAGSLRFAVPLLVAVIAVSVFVRHINGAAHPLIAPNLIYGPGFGTVNLVNAIYGGITNGSVALIPLYAANRYGIDALGSGTLLIAQGAAAILLSVAGALLLRRTGHRLPLYAGGITIALGLLLLALSPADNVSPYVWLAGSAFLVGAGGGALNPASRNAGLQLAPEHSSTLAALRSASLQIGSITTVSIVTASLTRSSDPGGIQAWTFVVAALLLVAFLPLIARVPEHRGSW